ncbi:unnamed protein product [Caenorhabditis bovis]|uniref:Secreted frizzled-related protein 1 n=1 Tax=Caenorhabditis bovis TaxID=2654633 RepID=A0A8S1F0Q7_9PELO|nr:unnamed protein product [Caenorhabditis bovis]
MENEDRVIAAVEAEVIADRTERCSNLPVTADQTLAVHNTSKRCRRLESVAQHEMTHRMLLLFLIISTQCFASGYLQDSWAMFSSEKPTGPKCVDIPSNLSICNGIEYAQMRLPNLLEHETVHEAIHASKDWESLLRLNCHPDTQRFLCSLFAPVCLMHMDREILPCRSLCLAVKQGCESRMANYGFPWPEMLSCDKYVDDDMCIKPVAPAQPITGVSTTCTACSQVATYENLVDQFCRSQLVVKGKIGKLTSTSISVRNGRSLKKGDRRRSVPETEIRLSMESDGCPCNITTKAKNEKLLVMASRQSDGKYTANLILPWKKDKNFKRAIHQFQRLNCQSLGREIRESASRRPHYYEMRRHNTGRYQMF